MKHTADSELRRIRDGIELHQCRRRHTVTHGNVVDGVAYRHRMRTAGITHVAERRKARALRTGNGVFAARRH